MTIKLNSLEKALSSLNRAILRKKDALGDEELRDAVIQRFEYTYELSWRMLKRVLEKEMPTPSEVDKLSFPDLLREGAERGIVKDVSSWLIYREQRNITSHTYNEQKAESVYETALQFYEDAMDLFNELKKKNRD
jgi:nucleotidyltransferase substrate binding protein (TIGR01987 family)